jgi:GNAT superfamily N-acetyltransferase
MARGPNPSQSRVATTADVEAIVTLTNLAYEVEKFFKAEPRLDAPEVRSLMTRGVFLVVDDDEGLAASVYTSVGGEAGYLGLLAVAPARQGTGLGRLLTETIERRCAAAGCSRLEIYVVDLRLELFTLYERLGFARTAATLPMPDGSAVTRPCHLVVMEKPLGMRPAP